MGSEEVIEGLRKKWGAVARGRGLILGLWHMDQPGLFLKMNEDRFRKANEALQPGSLQAARDTNLICDSCACIPSKPTLSPLSSEILFYSQAQNRKL